MWRGEIVAKVTTWALTGSKPAPTGSCEVQNMSCTDLVRTLNSFRSGRYYEASGKLLGVSMEDASMYRDNGAMVFKLKDGKTIIHNQGLAGLEKGYMTVILSNGHWMKFNDKGNFVSES